MIELVTSVVYSASIEVGSNFLTFALAAVAALPGIIAAVKATGGKRAAEATLSRLQPSSPAPPGTIGPSILDELRSVQESILERVDRLTLTVEGIDGRLAKVEAHTGS